MAGQAHGMGPLEQKLQALRRQTQEKLSRDAVQGFEQCLERMRARVDGPKGLALGARALDFVLNEAWGASFWLKESLEQGPTIVVFYRGGWCRYCEETLAAWQDCLEELTQRGLRLVAISPQYPEATGKIVRKLKLEFPVLCDPGNRVARKFDLVYRPEEMLQEIHERAGADLVHCNKDCSQELPIPATFLISENFTVLYRHFDVDFTRRAEPAEVLAQLDKEGA